MEVADAWKIFAMSFATLQKLALVAMWREIWDGGRWKRKDVIASRARVSVQLEERRSFDCSVVELWEMREDEPDELCVGWMGEGWVAIALVMPFDALMNWCWRGVT